MRLSKIIQSLIPAIALVSSEGCRHGPPIINLTREQASNMPGIRETLPKNYRTKEGHPVPIPNGKPGEMFAAPYRAPTRRGGEPLTNEGYIRWLNQKPGDDRPTKVTYPKTQEGPQPVTLGLEPDSHKPTSTMMQTLEAESL